MGGKELINQLRDLQPDLNYIFMSGYVGDTISLDEELPQGAKFIQKPLSLVSLARQVRELLDTRNGADAANPN
jgi:two-component system cell cycle sensor histidine kinase/response regulator CckA